MSSRILQIPGFGGTVLPRAVAGCEEPNSGSELTGCSDGYTKFHVAMEYWKSSPEMWGEVTRMH